MQGGRCAAVRALQAAVTTAARRLWQQNCAFTKPESHEELNYFAGMYRGYRPTLPARHRSRRAKNREAIALA